MSAQLPSRVALAAVLLCFAAHAAAGQLPSVETSAGVDASGVHHTWTTDRGKPAPWQSDVTKLIPPDYPYVARRSKQEGSGLFRLEIELATGKVSKVVILKS